MKLVRTLAIVLVPSAALAVACGTSSISSSVADSGVTSPPGDGAVVSSDAGSEASYPREGGSLGASCNISPACDAPQECCLPSLADLGLSGICVAPGTCHGVALGCDRSSECMEGQACCLMGGVSSCQTGPCAPDATQLCDPGAAGHRPPECPTGETCDITRACVPSDGGAADANLDASTDAPPGEG
jgi:hypothetical protein